MRADVSAGDLSQTIGEIYAAAHEPAHWNAAIGSIRRLLDGSKACLVPFGPDISPDQCLSDGAALDMNTLLFQDFFEDFLPFAARVQIMPIGVVYEDHAIHSPRVPLRDTRFWQEWMAPQDMYGGIGCRLIDTPGGSWFFDVQRGARQPGFDAAALGLVGLLVPHLQQAMSLSLRAGLGAKARESLDSLPFGMMLVDSALRIHTMNPAADALIEDPASPLRRRGGRLVVAQAAGGMEALRRRMAEACPADRLEPPVPGRDIVLRSPLAPGEGLVVSVSPLGATGSEHRFAQRLAAIAIRKFGGESAAEGLEPQLRRAFDLSAREATLAAGLARGHSLRETADRNAIAFSTARSYLETVFAKTGTRRQGELIALARSLEPLLRMAPGA